MALKFVFFFAVLAIVGANEECGEEKAGVCVEKLLSALLGDLEEEQACVELKDVSKCLRDAADECLGEDRDPEIDEGLQELDNLLEQNCPAAQEDKDYSKCAEENEDYFMECVSISMREVDELLGQPDSIDMDLMKCSVYSLMKECMVDRIAEKCGEEVRKEAQEEMEEMPLEIKQACANQDAIDIVTAQLLDKKKK